MAEKIRVRVISPERELLDEMVDQVIAEGALGQLGVLPNHTAFVTWLEPGVLELAGGSRQKIAIKSGFVEVKDDIVTVLADEAIPVDKVDAAHAHAATKAAAARLEAAPFGNLDHDNARRDQRWAEVLESLAAGASGR